MTAVNKREIKDDATFERLLDFHVYEIRVRDGKISQLIEMVERQASELLAARHELNACKARLASAAA